MIRSAVSLSFVLLLTGLPDAGKVELKKQTEDAFASYLRTTEARLDKRLHDGDFLWADDTPDRKRRVQSGEVVVEPVVGKGDAPIAGGLVHDWIGAVFIPRTSLEKTLALAQDVDRHKSVYQPEVRDSRLVNRSGNDLKVYLRLVKKKVITVVLNTYHDVRYVPVDPTRWYSRSYSTRIAEVENSGSAKERELPPGQDHGFLWRLDSYWSFEERDGGVYVECEAVSLTRDVPTGLGWLINPIVRSLPRESLTSTLRATRDAL